MFCDNCEGQSFEKKTAFVMGLVGHEVTWTTYVCNECGLFKIIKTTAEEEREKNDIYETDK